MMVGIGLLATLTPWRGAGYYSGYVARVPRRAQSIFRRTYSSIQSPSTLRRIGVDEQK